MKNLLIKFLVFVLRPFFSSHTEKKSVLIVSTTGLGDTMWATPSLRALYAAGKNIVLLTGPYGSHLFKNCPYPIKIYSTSHAPLWKILSLFTTLRKHHFEEIFVFHASQRSLFPMLALLQPQSLHGFKGYNKGLDCLFTHLIEKQSEHEIMLRLSMIKQPDASTQMELYTPVNSQDTAQKKQIAIFPGSKDAYKRWPKEYFIELGKKFMKDSYTLYIVGASDEKHLVTSISENIVGARPLYSYSLNETICLIQSCQLCIANDSGPMHLAFAAGVPTIGLFSPTSVQRYGPLNIPRGMVIQRETPCSPCLRRNCRDNFCMRQISPETVYKEAKKWLI